MEEIRRKLLEAERTMKELRQTEEDLKQQNSAAYKAAQVFKNKYDNLVPITVGLSKLLNVKVDGLVNLESKGSVDEGVNFLVSGSGKRVREIRLLMLQGVMSNWQEPAPFVTPLRVDRILCFEEVLIKMI